MLPDSFIEKYKSKGAATLVFGEPIVDFTRDELFAVLGLMCEREEQAQKAHAQERRMTEMFRKAKEFY